MTKSSADKKVVIVGAGLVGSLWAILLRQQGYEVEIYEKRSDPRQAQYTEQRSINLIITSRGMHGLAQAGLLNQAVELSVPIHGRMIHSSEGHQTYQPYGKKNEYNLSISRAALNCFLITQAEKAGAQIFFDQELESANFAQNKVQFKSGRKAEYDLLFGADGAGSLVRKNLIVAAPDRFTERIDWLPAEYIELYLPKPASNKTSPSSTFEKNALHIWPRGERMMMALANLDGSFTVTLYMPDAQKFKTVEDAQKLFESEFRDATALMPNYKNEFLNHPRGRLGTVRCSNWTLGGSVALIGDAAHAILPFFGQGMNCGFEDCTFLLEALKHSDGDWGTTLESYNSNQKPNGNAIADMAYENWFEMSTKVADQNFLARKKLESILEAQFPSVFKSRYGMVTYTLIPYATVQRAGLILDKILEDLLMWPGIKTQLLSCTFDAQSNKDFFARAQTMLEQNFKPFLIANRIEFQTQALREKRTNKACI